jgi:hypothetical protein
MGGDGGVAARRLMRGMQLALVAAFAACGGPSKQAGAGESCFRVADCELGLICGPDQKCTSDLTGIDIRPEASTGIDVSAGGGGAAPDASTGAGGAAGTMTGGSTAAGGGGSAGAGGSSSGNTGGSDWDASE